jgi:hypothetical protein
MAKGTKVFTEGRNAFKVSRFSQDGHVTVRTREGSEFWTGYTTLSPAEVRDLIAFLKGEE